MEKKEFLSDPVVYPSINSLIDDVKFKSNSQISCSQFYTKEGIQVKKFAELKRSDQRIFGFHEEIKKKTLRSLINKFDVLVSQRKILMNVFVEEFSDHNRIMKLKEISIDDSYFRDKLKLDEFVPTPMEQMDMKLELIEKLNINPNRLRCFNVQIPPNLS